MLAILYLLGTFVANLFTSRRRLEVENLFLRHQLNIALRRTPHRLRLRGNDRALLELMTWLWPGLLGLSHIVQPATILRWHRAGFRACWRWKSSGRPGRPKVDRELRELVQRMSKENRLLLIAASLEEAKRRGRLLPNVQANQPDEPTRKRSSRMAKSSHRPQVEVATVSLTRGQVNAVRAAFKAGIKPSVIARQFGISQSDVRKVLSLR
jgi:hypothetical protein